MSLSSYFEQARKNASNHVHMLRDFRYFLSSIGIVESSIVLEDDLVLSKVKEEAVKDFFFKYLRGIPLDYILNESSFFGYSFYVDKRVLIPRPETELLVEEILSFSLEENAKIVEVGTGSGCMAISLALLKPNFKIIASDISSSALEVALLNLKKHKPNNLLLVHSDWLTYAKPSSIDLVVSNPPYLKLTDPHLSELSNEPVQALVSPGGTKSFFDISDQAMIALKPGGIIIYEHGCFQQNEVVGVLKESGFSNIQTIKDFQGLDRIVYGYKY